MVGWRDLNPHLVFGYVRPWVLEFVRWYNTERRHSALKFVTPAQRHEGADIAILVRARHSTKRPSSQPRALARHHPELGSSRHRVPQSGTIKG